MFAQFGSIQQCGRVRRVFREGRRRGFGCLIFAQLEAEKQRPSAEDKPVLEGARLPNLPPSRLPHPLLLPHAHRHDLQLLALWLRGRRSRCWVTDNTKESASLSVLPFRSPGKF